MKNEYDIVAILVKATIDEKGNRSFNLAEPIKQIVLNGFDTEKEAKEYMEDEFEN